MSRNERARSHHAARWTIVGNPDCRRVAAFQTALAQQRKSPAQLVSYADLLRGSVRLQDCVQAGDLIRFESAAEEWRTRRLLLEYGSEEAPSLGYAAAFLAQISSRVGPDSPEYKPRQLYLGYRRLLHELAAAVTEASAVALQSPLDIACMFDKWKCQNRLHQAGVPIPQLLSQPRNFLEVMNGCDGHSRVMLKMSHGSGGVGCMALHCPRGPIRAFVSSQTMAMCDPNYPNLHVPIQKLDDLIYVAGVGEMICAEQAHLEVWLPKAHFEGKPFDLRVVVIAGKPRHAIARLGQSTFTNLNLGGQRRDIGLLEKKIGADGWAQIEQIAAQVAGCFPQTLCFGLDLLMTPRRDFYVLEVNAFGDFLLNVFQKDETPYAAEIAAVDAWLTSRSAAAPMIGAST